ncbi:tetratricopeptide repeat protein [Massilia niastensis]|uniref:tetratricopeptide repeat protein n=1 Tax=Massilia niastensis TaxID=544911 RepID=UPI00037D6C92|nr:tetratricopeptide repeat protein [Massilia niastensis]
MSLINQMLQDLDARAGQPGAVAMPSHIRPVQAERRRAWLRPTLVAAAVAGLGAAGAVGWSAMSARPAAPAATPAPLAVAAAPSAVGVELPVPKREPVIAAPAAAPGDTLGAKGAASAAQAPAAAAPPPVAKASAVRGQSPAPKQRDAVRAHPKREAAPRAAAVRKPEASAARPQEARAKPAPKAAAGRVETAAQRAENGYGRALASLEHGRVNEAIAHLQAALRADPRHEPSRQTLVSLLVEARRPDEAMRQLQAALALDPRQPALAMLLARLQLERGGPAIATLTRTLPYAKGNGDYHAFLAGVLQREQRHREAAEQYQTALRTAPHNGVWWMGLGISLQAEKRNAEAAEAFQKARAGGALSAELQTFVERQLKQLGQ